MKIDDISVDPVKIEEGDWVENIPDCAGLRLKVRGIDNKRYQKMMSQMYKSVPRKKRIGGDIDPDEQQRIIAICLRDTCLLDWDGIDDKNGNPLPYSKEQANEYLTKPKHRRFYNGVMWAASVVGDQESVEIEEDVGNSPEHSAGTTSGVQS